MSVLRFGASSGLGIGKEDMVGFGGCKIVKRRIDITCGLDRISH